MAAAAESGTILLFLESGFPPPMRIKSGFLNAGADGIAAVLTDIFKNLCQELQQPTD